MGQEGDGRRQEVRGERWTEGQKNKMTPRTEHDSKRTPNVIPGTDQIQTTRNDSNMTKNSPK